MMQETPPQSASAEASADRQLIVEDVVAALTGEGQVPEVSGDLREMMQRAAEEFDRRTADAFGRALLDSLCEDPGNLRQLEALLILGLAHPDVLRRNRISLAVEGRRLAVLLERSGDVQRARCVLELLSSNLPDERTIDHELAGILRRTGQTDELIERYVSRAQECINGGRSTEAIPWLQEVLLLDRTRRDVARMIRDLRYQEAEKSAKSTRRRRLIVVILVLSAAVSGVLAREMKIRMAYQELPLALPRDQASVEARIAGLDDLIGSARLWSGVMDAIKERDALEAQIKEIEHERARADHEREIEQQRLAEMAEAARMRGLMHAQRGDHTQALVDLKRALSLSAPDWEHRVRLESDIAALEALQEQEQ
jgi:tetratricopeptide (TPR) repeat protein